MADALDPLGGKRKYQPENPLTAKAETGSLKIKIMRKGEMFGSGLSLSNISSDGLLTAPRSPVNAPPVQVQSPPKPRPNRKHVPIFYQRPNAFDISGTSSTDENYSQTQTSVTSDYDASVNVSSASTSSTTGRFARMELSRENSLIGASGVLGELLPTGNPLFSRGNSETGGMLTDLLKHVFPPTLSAENSYEYQESSHVSEPESTSLPPASLLNPAAALRQLASSSAAYSMQSRDLSYNSVMPSTLPTEPPLTQHNEQKSYHFDPMSALQDAVKMAVATTSPTAPQSSYARLPSADHDDADADGDLGPPPSAPPAFGIQHSLMGGGIEAQPNIANVNTVNFDWTRHQRQHGLSRPRSGSLPNVVEDDTNNHRGHDDAHAGANGK